MAKKTKKARKPKAPKNKTTEDRLTTLEVLSRANKVLGHAEVFIQRMKELADTLRKRASFVERDDGTIDPNDMANILCGIANTIEAAMEV